MKLDYRYLYTMEQRNQGILSKIFGGRFIKIGISNNPKRREQTVNRAFGSKREIALDHNVKILWARKRESALKKLLKACRFRPLGVKKGGGRTECYKVRFWTYWMVRFLMGMWWIQTVFLVYTFRILIFSLIIIALVLGLLQVQ